MSLLLKLIGACVLLMSAQGFQFDNRAGSIDAALGGVPAPAAFRHWMEKHGKEYDSTQEEEYRYTVWRSNVELVLSKNAAATHSVRLGINGHADLTRDEFRAGFVHNPRPFEAPAKKDDKDEAWRYDTVAPAASVDWRTQGVVGPIRNQHANNWSCGSCWAFATVGISEIASSMYTGRVVPASEQQLIDCDRKHDFGCDGGDIHNGLDYIVYNHGLNTEDNYPYIGHDDECHPDLEKKHKVKIDDWEHVPSWNESALMQAITMMPVVTAVCCGNNIDDWHHYTGGVFDVDCCSDEMVLDHAMVILGYGEEDGEEYWLLKNSWGTDWGEEGFIKMRRFTKDGKGQCFLTSMPTMVVRGNFPPSNSQVMQTAVHHALSTLRKLWFRIMGVFKQGHSVKSA